MEGVARVESATLELTAIVEPIPEVVAGDVEEEQASVSIRSGDDGGAAHPCTDDV